MELTPGDVEKGMKSPDVWETYKKIVNNAEGHEVWKNNAGFLFLSCPVK